MAWYRSYLYVPGDRPDRIKKALATDADAVVIDLEDSVDTGAKRAARETVSAVLAGAPPKPVFVRINSGRDGEVDLEMITGDNLDGVRIPKVTARHHIELVAAALEGRGCDATVHCLLEDALGVERAFMLATAHPRVTSIGLGEADLRASLHTTDDAALDWARSRVVVASAAAGIDPPVQSVYPYLRDAAGLRASTVRGRAFGFFGRSAIHPEQVPVINEVFTPTPDEVAAARAVVAAHAVSATATLDDGTFVDRAVARHAQRTIDLAERLALAGGR